MKRTALLFAALIGLTAMSTPRVFTLPNGQRCFVAESGLLFCTEEKGIYKMVSGQ